MAMRSLVKYGVLLCFFASGATGLIYEVIWAKYLTLFIGNTTYTHTIVIATFMGGPLPVLSRVFVRSFEQVGHTVSLLYFINSLGAVFGTVAAGFVFIVSFGLPGTIYLAAITNAMLGLIAISLDFAEYAMEQRE